MIKQIAVIGAGPSGLVTIKELVSDGFEVMCFESTNNIGGLYQYKESGPGIYDSLKLTSSSFITLFSDFFPYKKKLPPHFSHTEYFEYLQKYVEHFNLRSYINFGKNVQQLKYLENRKWSLTTEDTTTHETETLIFDAVAVCSGVHQNPTVPENLNLDSFKGEIIHSSLFRNAKRFKGKNVVVLGAGEGASDIVDEISKTAQKCILSIRRGVLVLPRLLMGEPNDYYTNRLFYMLPFWLLRSKHLTFHWPSMFLVLISGLFFCNSLLITEKFMSFIFYQSQISAIFFETLYLGLVLYLVFALIHFLFFYLTPKTLTVMAKLMRDSGAGHGEQFAVKSQGIAVAIAEGRAEIKREITGAQNNQVIFADKSCIDNVDSIVLCTGYKIFFPFLDSQTIDFRELYKNCFMSDFGSSLCFIGFTRPAIGSIPPVSELQARWFKGLLSQKKTLPSLEEMKKEIQKDAQAHKKLYKNISNRLPGLIDYTSYMDEIAQFIGCKPRLHDLLKSPSLFLHFYCNPFSAHQYRLCGIDHNRTLAKSVMRRIKIKPIRLIYCYALFVVIFISKIFYRLGFSKFKTNLNIEK